MSVEGDDFVENTARALEMSVSIDQDILGEKSVLF